MKTVRVYRHPACPRCARYARWHHRLDWLDRFEDSTEEPATGAVRKGRIVIRNLRSGAYYRDADGFAFLFRQIPAYWPLLPLMWLRATRQRLQQELDQASPTMPSGDVR